MQVVLINPYNPSARGTNRATSEPPLGLAYLAAVLRANAVSCRIIDADMMQMDEASVARTIAGHSPSLIGISCNIVNYRGAVSLSKKLKVCFPRTLLILGGPYASSQADVCITDSEADLVVVGEGEETILEIVRHYRGSTDSLGKLKGIVYKRNGEIVQTGTRPLIDDLDSIPFPARDLLPPGHPYGSRLRASPADAILTSRGCPHCCVYCDKEIFKHRFRARSPDNVLAEIDMLARGEGVRQLDILDENFTLDAKRAEQILDEIIERRYDMWINLMNGIRADRLSQRLVDKMKRAGVYCVSIGIESGDQEVVDKNKKQLDLSTVVEATRWLRDAGIIVYGNFMFGLLGDTAESMRRTIDFAVRLNPHIANFQIVCPFPGTELYGEIVKRGRFIVPTDHGVDLGFYAGTAFFELNGTRAEDVEFFFRRAYRRFYFRASKILDILLSIRSRGELRWLLMAISDKLLKLFYRRGQS